MARGLAVTYICSGNPAAAGSSRALMTRMTPDSFSHRTRCSVAAGDKPTMPGEFHVRAIRIGLQGGKELYVNFIKFNGHVCEILVCVKCLGSKFRAQACRTMAL